MLAKVSARIASFGLVCGLFAYSNASPQTAVEKAKRDEVSFMSNDDPAMKRAFERARASLDEFLAQSETPSPSTSGYALKVAVTENGQTEYFWVVSFSRAAADFSGVVSNEPRLVKSVRAGQRIRFGRNRIVDWMYIDNAARRMHGNFTACALLTKEPPQSAKQFQQQYGLTCE